MEAKHSESEFSISLQGRLLLAAPALRDGVFSQAVILLEDHSHGSGAIGKIINHRTETTVGDLVGDLKHSPLGSLAVHHGGPVGSQQLSFSSWGWSPQGDFFNFPQISVEKAESLISKPKCVVQATVGYSSWSPGQLENELVGNTWLTLKPATEILSGTLDNSLWKRLLTSISPYHALLSQAPKNPLLN